MNDDSHTHPFPFLTRRVHHTMAECDNYTSASTCQCTQPDSGSEADRAQFWSEFEQVLDLQKQRVAGGMAGDVIDLPELFKGYTMDQASQAVRADL